jgi:hypothetical protein
VDNLPLNKFCFICEVFTAHPFCQVRSAHLSSDTLLRDTDSEYRSLVQFTLDMNLAAHRLYKLFCYVHTQTCTNNSAVIIQVKPFVCVKNLADLFFCHTLPRIAYNQNKSTLFLRFNNRRNRKLDLTLIGILKCVGKDIVYYLFYTHFIAVQIKRR